MKAAYVGIDLLYPALPALADTGCEILRVFTCETDNVTEFNTQVSAFAREKGIPLQTSRMTAGDLEDLRRAGCELVLCGGYYYRLPMRKDLYMVNIHPALLPVGRGAWPMPVTILKGLPESGVTMHRMTEGLDEGDVLLSRRVEVAPEENLRTLTDKLRALLPGMVRELAADLPALWDSAMPQEEEKAKYWPTPTERDWTVNEHMSPAEADRILRAFYGYEVIYERGGERWELIDAELADAAEAGIFSLPFGEGKVIRAGRARRIS